MKLNLIPLLFLISTGSFAASMSCRMTEMIDFGMWSGFPKSQVQLDPKMAEVVETQIGNNLKIDLQKIADSKVETLLILKSSTASEKLELVIRPVADSVDKFHMVMTQLSNRAAVVSTKELEFSSTTTSLVRIAIDGNGKTMMAECDLSP